MAQRIFYCENCKSCDCDNRHVPCKKGKYYYIKESDHNNEMVKKDSKIKNLKSKMTLNESEMKNKDSEIMNLKSQMKAKEDRENQNNLA